MVYGTRFVVKSSHICMLFLHVIRLVVSTLPGLFLIDYSVFLWLFFCMVLPTSFLRGILQIHRIDESRELYLGYNPNLGCILTMIFRLPQIGYASI